MTEVDCLCMCVREWKQYRSAVGRTEQDLELGTKTASPILPGDVTNSRGSSPSCPGNMSSGICYQFSLCSFFVTVENSDPARIFVAISQNFLLQWLVSIPILWKTKQVCADRCGVTLTMDNVASYFHVIVTLTNILMSRFTEWIPSLREKNRETYSLGGIVR